jgi:geranylgeranyl diphosphate synthase type I
VSSTDPHTAPDNFRHRVREALTEFLAVQRERVEPMGPEALRLVDEAAELLAGGKRLRAAFCEAGFAAAGGNPEDPAMQPALARACAALEILHASALVHDDLMDDSATRRGRPTTHLAFRRIHHEEGWPAGRQSDARRYGEAAAILLGDLMLSWADELLRTSGFPADRVLSALAVLDQCRSEVIVGQFLDVSVQARGRADVETAMTVVRYKSAKYSVERPLHVGAALAGADEGMMRTLTDYGLPLGEAFQLRDDLLGVFGDPEVTGKPAGDDLVQGKRTVLVALTLDNASGQEASLLDHSLGTDLDGAGIARLRDIIEESGAKAQVEAAIELLTERALHALEKADTIPATAIEHLRVLAAAATKRAR